MLSLEGLGDHLGTILLSCWGIWASWKLYGSLVRVGNRFPHQNAGHFGGIWRPLREGFGDFFQSFLDIDFAISFHLLLK